MPSVSISTAEMLLGALPLTVTFMGVNEVAGVLKVSGEAVRGWLKRYLVEGVGGLRAKKSPGRPPKLSKSQRRKLCELSDAGPAKAGLNGNCWRSPMIQHLIHEHFGVYFSARYISALLKSMGYSYQKARFVSGHLDQEARAQWLLAGGAALPTVDASGAYSRVRQSENSPSVRFSVSVLKYCNCDSLRSVLSRR